MTRIERLAALLEEPLLVAGPPYVLGGQANVHYLTGLHSSNAAVLVEPDGSATLYTDFRYANRARALDGAEVVETARGLIPAIGELLSGRRILIEEQHLPHAFFRALADAGVDAVPISGLVETLRAVKDDDEIACMRRASALSDEVFAALAQERFSGRSERELAWWIERSFREGGAEGVSFEAVVGAGATAASPHAVPGDAPIEAGVLVVVDAGCVLDGYCSDCTRTFAVGDISQRLSELYALCHEAQLAGLAAVAPGVQGSDADAASRTLIEAQGLGWAYGHGMGHGVGLQIHEAPTLRPESTDVLEAGNVVSVEPGIYIPDEGAGVRIEDLVLVTDDGCERLTAVHEGAPDGRVGAGQLSPLQCRGHGRDRQHEPVSQRDAHRDRRRGLADRRVPAREARQGWCVRADEAEGTRRPAPSSIARFAPARSSRASTPR